MAIVAGRNRVNRPYFFKNADGSRMEVPSFGFGQGDLDGAALREFNMYVTAKQIEAAASVGPDPFTNAMWSVAGDEGKITVTITSLPDGNGLELDSVSVTVPGQGDFIINAEIGAQEITDLDAGTYDVTLTAITAGGESAASPSKEATVS